MSSIYPAHLSTMRYISADTGFVGCRWVQITVNNTHLHASNMPENMLIKGKRGVDPRIRHKNLPVVRSLGPPSQIKHGFSLQGGQNFGALHHLTQFPLLYSLPSQQKPSVCSAGTAGPTLSCRIKQYSSWQ